MTGRILLVLGPHRSGTSLLARSMESLVGARTPVGSDWKAHDNPAGFFEAPIMITMNDRILAMFDRKWSSPEPLPHGFEGHPAVRYGLFSGGRAVMRRIERDDADTLIVKDPRMCRLLPFWRTVFAECGYEVSVVRSLRHPLECARSLEKRNGIGIARGLALWLEHMRCCREHVPAEWRQTGVLFDRLTALPRYAIERVSGSLRMPIDPPALTTFCTEFWDESLRHERAGDEDDAELPTEIAAVWKLERNKAMRGDADG